jgi:hypothetical protein
MRDKLMSRQRPVEEVRRDPLAVMDVRTADQSEWEAASYRAISNVTPSGEYYLESLSVKPPKKPEEQRWYFMPNQQPNEVLIIKFADTQADIDSTVSRGCPHLSPQIPGTENEIARCSLECRVIAFWE